MRDLFRKLPGKLIEVLCPKWVAILGGLWVWFTIGMSILVAALAVTGFLWWLSKAIADLALGY